MTRRGTPTFRSRGDTTDRAERDVVGAVSNAAIGASTVRAAAVVAVMAIAAVASVSLSPAPPAVASSIAASAHSAAVPTSTQDFEFASYDADFYLDRDAQGHATLRTVETLVAVFPSFDQNRGIIRAIPNDYDGVPLETRVVSVVDERGAPVHFESSTVAGFTELALGTDEFVHGRTTYVITYEQRNVIRAFGDTAADEFYWDTNGTGWAQPFRSVAARVHVDDSIVEFLTGAAACYDGAEGEQGSCALEQVDGPTGVMFVASALELAPHETLTVAIGFESDTFVQVAPQLPDAGGEPGGIPDFPGPYGDAWWAPVVAGITAILGLSGAGFVIWRRFGGEKDAAGRGVIIPQYTPPKNLTVLEASHIAGRPDRAVAAQIVSLAVRKKVRILDYPVTASGAQYSVQLLDASGLDDLETQLLVVLFGDELVPGAVAELGVVNSAMASGMSRLRYAARSRVLARGFIRDRPMAGGCIAVVVLFVLSIVAVFALVASFMFGGVGWSLAALAIVVVAFVLSAAFAWRPAITTEAGAEHRDYLFGIRDYLLLAEADRMRMLQSASGAERINLNDEVQVVKLYEKLLPFAVLWGIEREWARELAVHFEASGQQPDWFVSSNAFSIGVFANALGGLSGSVSTSSTTPSSSSSWSGSSGGSFSGGSFGGGFSGGGGGGGGGGGR